MVGFHDPKNGYRKPKLGLKAQNWVWGHQSWVSRPQSWVSRPQFCFQGPKVGFQGPKVGFQGPKVGFQDPKVGFQGPKVGFQGPKAGFQGPKVGFQGPKVGFPGPRWLWVLLWGWGPRGAGLPPLLGDLVLPLHLLLLELADVADADFAAEFLKHLVLHLGFGNRGLGVGPTSPLPPPSPIGGLENAPNPPNSCPPPGPGSSSP